MKRRRAFTFIELLIVIAIVSVVAAVLFPVFAKAKTSRANCLDSQVHISQGASLYTQDYDENATLPAPEVVSSYVGSTKECPLVAPTEFRRSFLMARDHVSVLSEPGNMTYHKGPIMHSVVAQTIFWGPKWSKSAFRGDKVAGLDLWYKGYSKSNYAKTNTEYKMTTTTGSIYVGTTLSYKGHLFDKTTAKGGDTVGDIFNEVCKMITTPDPSGNGYYAVYTDLPRGNAGYCAWHSAGTCNGAKLQFAFFWDLDGDPGCNPGDTSGLHSQGLAALANVTGHELSEAVTDPRINAWYDSQGGENADKCAWSFNVPLVTFSNGTQWKIQGNWSNKAFSAGTGYKNRAGQKGCLDGH